MGEARPRGRGGVGGLPGGGGGGVRAEGLRLIRGERHTQRLHTNQQ